MRRIICFLLFGFSVWFSGSAYSQSLVRDRITQPLSSGTMVAVPGSVHPLAKAQFDAGPVSASTAISGMTMYFQPSAEQQAALNALLQAQQTPGSPYYHRWITPTQYASQFGLSSNDLAKVKAWLEQQGFAVERVSNSRNAIVFSGTAAQVESAFQTQLHHYIVNGVTHTANATAFSIPSALSGVVLSVSNVADFRPHPLHRSRSDVQATGHFDVSSGGTTDHFLAPGDFATIYDVNALYSAGYTGSGVTIAVMGESLIASADITNFQSASGLTQKAPTMTLVPNSGTGAYEASSGDEDESDLDVEWSGAVAKGATINFVYVGNAQNYSVFNSLQYAIDNNLAPILSISYGACEADFASSEITTYESLFAQANSQGQTIVASSGDDGATDCEVTSGSGGGTVTVVNGDEATKGLAVDYPGSSPEVTSMGGTTLNGDESSPSTYWNSSNSSSNSSAIQYIPETVWNDTSTANGPEASGGGVSILFGKPSWQTGTGVPSDGHRDVPDISLAASPNHDGYLFCASEAGGKSPDTSICTNDGYFDTAGNLDIAGGTSFGAPTFSGMLALLIQKLGVTGLGNVNPEIYALAAADYASAFHDVTTGNNEIPCVPNSTDCTTSPIGYSATTGYDLTTGWGSLDAANFAGVYTTTATSSPVATTTSLTSSPTSPVTVGTAVTLTATVAANSGSSTPAGTVQFAVNGTALGSVVTLSSGVATTTFTPTAAGTDTVTATYTPSDAATNSASSGTLSITVNATGTPSLSLAAANVSVTQGSTGTSTITVTPSGGFTGNVSLTATVAPASTTAPTVALNSASVDITSTAAGSATLTVSTSSSTTAGTYTVTIQATSGSVTATATSTVTVTAIAPATFTLSGSTAAAIATPGGTTTSTITVNPANGFSSAVMLSCAITSSPAGATDAPSCSLSPTSTTTTSTLTVVTTAATNSALNERIYRPFAIGGGLAVAGLMLFGIPARRRSWRAILGLVLFAGIVDLSLGCGSSSGSGTSGNSGTTTGAYVVTVTGTSGSITTTTPVSVIVN